jgi:hypothetical protein
VIRAGKLELRGTAALTAGGCGPAGRCRAGGGGCAARRAIFPAIIPRVNDHQPRMDRATGRPTGPTAVFRAVDLATSRSGATVVWRIGRRDLPTVLAGTGIAATGIDARGVRTIHGNRGSARASTATAVPLCRVFGPAPGRRTRRFLRAIVEADQATWATAAQCREDRGSTAAVLLPRTGRADSAAGCIRPHHVRLPHVGGSACRRHRSGRHGDASRCVLPPRSPTASPQRRHRAVARAKLPASAPLLTRGRFEEFTATPTRRFPPASERCRRASH